MYIPAHFEESRIEVLHALMRERPLATLVVLTPDGLSANHIPLHLDPAAGEWGTLRGHVARANPLWRERLEEVEALAIFQGPGGYVSPSWYPTKAEHGRAVPTWNYVAVHARGRLRVIDDAAWLRRQLDALTAQHEAALQPKWAVTDAPADYIERMLKAIVGIELTITRLEGKTKLSQNQPAANQAGVVAGLLTQGDAAALELARAMEGRSAGESAS